MGAETDLEFCVLGPIEVRADGELIAVGGPQQRRVLAALLSEAGNVVSLERLEDVVWPDGDSPDGARRSLMTYVSRLRNALGNGYVTTREPGYLLEPGAERLDARLFEALLDEARTAAPTRAIALLDRALGLWRGPAFGEFGSEWWARPAAVRLEELRLGACEERAEAQLASGLQERAVSDLEGLVATYPLRERLVGQLMRALQASGRQAEALRAYTQYREFLAEETGLEPTESLVVLDREITLGNGVHGSVGPPELTVRGYVLGDMLGEGAFGNVFKAVQPGVGREVAVKVIRPDLADDPQFVQRFEAEAQLVARLEHPHIVPLYDFWREPGGAYLVFRLLRGGNAERSLVVDGPWTLERVSRLLEEIGGALIAAHAAGIVHRDIKPANILFDEAGMAYLADFGISVAAGSSDPGVGYSAGSPMYAGPEQFHGADATPENDIYSLAITVWELLCGVAPFAGESPAEILRSKSERPLPPVRDHRPDVPEVVDAVLRRATSVRPEDRYPSAAEFVIAWQSAVGRSVLGSTTGGISAPDRKPRTDAAATMAQLQAGLTNPYKGLRPFIEADARDFHGRSSLVDHLADLVAGSPFVAVVGPSGSGKSSLVHAGLTPRLREAGMRIATMVPGADPVAQLRTALEAIAVASVVGSDPAVLIRAVAEESPGGLLLVVDQFEETWTLTEPDEREMLLQGLAAVAREVDRVNVIVTIRADFFDRPLSDPSIGPLVSAATLSVTPMTSGELLDAIRMPALSAGVTFEDGLATRLVADVVAQPASLPLLQFTLAELYDDRRNATITTASYERLGGVGGAIAARAESVYAELDSDGKRSLRRLFGRLVSPDSDALDTRRRAMRSELPDAMLEIVDRLGEYRLLTFDHDPSTREPTIEVAHESLLRSWPRLREWLDEDRDWLRQLAHVTTAAASWIERGREPSDLYRGSRLAATNEWSDDRRITLSALESEFLDASRQQAAEAQRRDIATRKRLSRLLVGTAVALVIALIAGGVAIVKALDANRQRTIADSSTREARLETLSNQSTALRGTQRDLAALLAVEARRLKPDARSDSALFSSLTQSSGFLGYLTVPNARGTSIATILGTSTKAAVETHGGDLERVDLLTGTADKPFVQPPKEPWDDATLRSSRDGRFVAEVRVFFSGTPRPNAIRLWDASTGALVFGPTTVPFMPGNMEFSRDGSQVVVSGGPNGELIAFRTADGTIAGRVAGLPKPADSTEKVSTAAVAFGPDGMAYLGSEAGPIRVIDPSNWTVVRTIDEPPNTATNLLKFPDDGTSNWVLASGSPRTSRIQLPSGAIGWHIGQSGNNFADECDHLALAAASHRLYCGNQFGRLDERDTETGLPTSATLDSQQGNTGDLFVTDGGRMLVAFGYAYPPVIARWRIDGSGIINAIVAPGQHIIGFANDNTHLIVGDQIGQFGPAGTLASVDPRSGAVGAPLGTVVAATTGSAPGLVYSMAFRDGAATPVATDAATGQAVPSLKAPVIVGDVPGAVSIDPRGRWLFLIFYPTASPGPTSDLSYILQLDARTLEQVGPRIHLQAAVNSISALPDGKRTYIAGVGTFSMSTGKQLTREDIGDVENAIVVGGTVVGNNFSGAISLYDGNTLRKIATLPGSRGYANQLLASRDGHTLVVRGGDRSVSLYDLASRTRIGVPLQIDQQDDSVASLSADGQTLAIGGGPRGVQLWDLRPTRWVEAACQLAGRNLTRDEWNTYLAWAGPYRRTCADFPSD